MQRLDGRASIMDRLSQESSVRRRLFEEDSTESELDNFTNVLQEEALRVQREKMTKWNFDFENERPLDGHFEWVRSEDGSTDYVGRARDAADDEAVEEANTDEEDCEEKVNLIQKKNETTPEKKDTEPLIRSDRRTSDSKNVFSGEKSVRRNIF